VTASLLSVAEGLIERLPEEVFVKYAAVRTGLIKDRSQVLLDASVASQSSVNLSTHLYPKNLALPLGAIPFSGANAGAQGAGSGHGADPFAGHPHTQTAQGFGEKSSGTFTQKAPGAFHFHGAGSGFGQEATARRALAKVRLEINSLRRLVVDEYGGEEPRRAPAAHSVNASASRFGPDGDTDEDRDGDLDVAGEAASREVALLKLVVCKRLEALLLQEQSQTPHLHRDPRSAPHFPLAAQQVEEEALRARVSALEAELSFLRESSSLMLKREQVAARAKIDAATRELSSSAAADRARAEELAVQQASLRKELDAARAENERLLAQVAESAAAADRARRSAEEELAAVIRGAEEHLQKALEEREALALEKSAAEAGAAARAREEDWKARLAALRAELTDARRREAEDLAARHAAELEAIEARRADELRGLTLTHEAALRDAARTHDAEKRELERTAAAEREAVRREMVQQGERAAAREEEALAKAEKLVVALHESQAAYR
jgi:hypothetical protein